MYGVCFPIGPRNEMKLQQEQQIGLQNLTNHQSADAESLASGP